MRQNCIFLGEGLLSYADKWAYLASLKRIPKAGGMKQSARFEAILVDGSFVTGKLAPNDVDILAVLRPGHDFERDLPGKRSARGRTKE